jgi:hypothetical protein
MMMRAVLVSLTLALPVALSAQICKGVPALGTHSVGSVGVGSSFFDGGKSYGVDATYGRQIFGSAGFSYVTSDGTDFSQNVIEGTIGYEATLENSTVSICPGFGIAYSFGLEIVGTDIAGVTAGPSLAVGLEADLSSSIAVVPFAETSVRFARVMRDDPGPAGQEIIADLSARLFLGVSFIFGDRVSLGSSVSLPITTNEGDTALLVGLSVAVGRSPGG